MKTISHCFAVISIQIKHIEIWILCPWRKQKRILYIYKLNTNWIRRTHNMLSVRFSWKETFTATAVHSNSTMNCCIWFAVSLLRLAFASRLWIRLCVCVGLWLDRSVCEWCYSAFTIQYSYLNGTLKPADIWTKLAVRHYPNLCKSQQIRWQAHEQ